MKLSKFLMVMWPLLLLAAAGCEVPTAEEDTDFSGTWVLTSTIVDKIVCTGGAPNDVTVEEFTIEQDGTNVSLQFEDHSALGAVVGDLLTANGVLPSGQAVSFELNRIGASLDGVVRIVDGGCQEERRVVATRRGENADFSGHWVFRLTAGSDDGCLIGDYDDCLRIIQTGDELLVVDVEAGNLVGKAMGNVAQIQRDNPTEVTNVVFSISPDGDQLVGSATRILPDRSCRTDLTLVATLRNEPCARFNH